MGPVPQRKSCAKLRKDLRAEIVIMPLGRLIFVPVLPLASHMLLFHSWDKYYYAHFTDEKTQVQKS